MTQALDRPMRFTILHRLLPAGWSQYFVGMGYQAMYRTVPYLTHSLGDLADAAVLVAKDEPEVRFSFQGEPGEYRWILEDTGIEENSRPLMHVRILDFADAYAREPDSNGKALIDGTCSKSQLLLNARSVLRETLAVNGEAGYREKTIYYDFPMNQLRELEKLTKDISDCTHS